jgi:membrane protease YdiL (CAAX protease family)
VSFLFVFLLAGALEEFGWRGLAQSRLQTRYPAVLVALGIGAAWATWHLPLFLLFDLGAYDPATLPKYYLALMFESVVLAWLFNGTGGSILAPMTFHAAGNMPAVMAVSGSFPGVLGLLDEHGYVVSIAVLAAVIVAVKGVGLAADSRSIPSGA